MATAMIVGLLPKQAERVRRAVGDRYRLRFIDSQGARRVQATSAINVLCADYITHGAQQRIERKLQEGQTLHITRGLEKAVIELLDNL